MGVGLASWWGKGLPKKKKKLVKKKKKPHWRGDTAQTPTGGSSGMPRV